MKKIVCVNKLLFCLSLRCLSLFANREFMNVFCKTYWPTVSHLGSNFWYSCKNASWLQRLIVCLTWNNGMLCKVNQGFIPVARKWCKSLNKRCTLKLVTNNFLLENTVFLVLQDSGQFSLFFRIAVSNSIFFLSIFFWATFLHLRRLGISWQPLMHFSI